MSPLLQPKPHKSYSELVNLLISRGMIVPDKNRAERKLSQIGYYRLSGFWYPCREFRTISRQADSGVKKKPQREDFFQPNINFNDIIDLYLFDKRLRLLILDAIERIEIHVRSVIAHELGRRDPLAYQSDVCKRLDIPKPDILKQWLQEINILRNKCAHHTKIWNSSYRNPLPTIKNAYFNTLNLDRNARKRMFGMICILWFLVKKIGPSRSRGYQRRSLLEKRPV
jgi:abortive infection bacteriophage resistance protein